MPFKTEEAEWLRKTRSLSGLKGHLTRQLVTLDKVLPRVVNSPSQAALDSLTSASKKMNEAFTKLEELASELMEESEFDEDYTTIEKYLGEADTLYKKYTEATLDAFAQATALRAVPQPPPPPGAAAAAAAPRQERPRIVEALRPDKLGKEATPVELRQWIARIKAFFSASGLDKCDINEQKAHFRACLESKLEAKLTLKIDNALEVLQEVDTSCLNVLRKEFKLKYPLFSRRMDYFYTKKKPGETPTEWSARLRAMADEADVEHLTVDQIHLFRLVAGVDDARLREKLMDLADPTEQQVEQLIASFEANQHASNSLTGGAAAAAASAYKKKSGQQGGEKKRLTREEMKGRCFGCGQPDYKPGHECPAKELICRNCSKKGHKSWVCQSPSKKKATAAVAAEQEGENQQQQQSYAQVVQQPQPQQQQQQQPAQHAMPAYSSYDFIHMVIVNNRVAEADRPTPRLSLNMRASPTGPMLTYRALPDSGATRTVVSADLARRMQCKLRPTTTTLVAANGSVMDCPGKTYIMVYNSKGEKVHTLDALVSSSMTDEMLISWHDLIGLGVISSSFPYTERVAAVQDAPIRTFSQVQKQLMDEFKDVFREAESKHTPMKGEPMKIHLRDDLEIKPIRCSTARQVPIHHQGDAKHLVKKLLEQQIIERVTWPTAWCSPAFFVPKDSGKGVRLITDFTQLNKFIKRPVHPFPSAADIMSNIPGGSTWFAALDAVQGYFHVPLEEKSRDLTTFLLPSGRHRYLRAPMGMSASSDEWCLRSDVIIEDVEGAQKIVDDVLVTAASEEELLEKVRQILRNCRQTGIAISTKKFQFCQRVKFAGYIVSDKGVEADPDRVKAIKDFPVPTDVTSLRSFLGLAQQLGSFIPDLAHMTHDMRQLLKDKIEWQWLEEHQKSFEETKAALTGPKLSVVHYDPKLPTELHTDASKLKGLGYALMQKTAEGTKLVKCGSRSLGPAEKNYAVIELECLGIKWATEQCKHWLQGHPGYQVVTDHRPLVGIFKKSLDDISNVRIQKWREWLVGYSFSVTWLAGAKNCLADALSRSPVFEPQEEEYVATAVVARCTTDSDPSLSHIAKASLEDELCKRTIQKIRQGEDPKKMSINDPCRLFASVWDELSAEGPLVVLNGSRIFVPPAARKEVLSALHMGHCGVVRTQQLARQLYYWPGITNEIKMMIDSCEACSINRAANPKQPEIEPTPYSELYPMAEVGVDLCEYKGVHHLVLVDRYSGYIMVARLNALDTGAVTKRLWDWFLEAGRPGVLRSDYGPQFRTEFEEFCSRMGIRHEISSAYNPSSNGLSENGVKQVKALLQKTKNFDEFREALAEWRNTPRADGLSASQLFMGRRQRTALPILPTALRETVTREEAVKTRTKTWESRESDRSQGTHELKPFKVGDKVRAWNKKSGKFDIKAKVTGIRNAGRSYTIEDGDGYISTRNRRLLNALYEEERVGENAPVSSPVSSAPTSGTPQTLRRSPRFAAARCVKSVGPATSVHPSATVWNTAKKRTESTQQSGSHRSFGIGPGTSGPMNILPWEVARARSRRTRPGPPSCTAPGLSSYRLPHSGAGWVSSSPFCPGESAVASRQSGTHLPSTTTTTKEWDSQCATVRPHGLLPSKKKKTRAGFVCSTTSTRHFSISTSQRQEPRSFQPCLSYSFLQGFGSSAGGTAGGDGDRTDDKSGLGQASSSPPSEKGTSWDEFPPLRHESRGSCSFRSDTGKRREDERRGDEKERGIESLREGWSAGRVYVTWPEGEMKRSSSFSKQPQWDSQQPQGASREMSRISSDSTTSSMATTAATATATATHAGSRHGLSWPKP